MAPSFYEPVSSATYASPTSNALYTPGDGPSLVVVLALVGSILIISLVVGVGIWISHSRLLAAANSIQPQALNEDVEKQARLELRFSIGSEHEDRQASSPLPLPSFLFGTTKAKSRKGPFKDLLLPRFVHDRDGQLVINVKVDRVNSWTVYRWPRIPQTDKQKFPFEKRFSLPPALPQKTSAHRVSKSCPAIVFGLNVMNVQQPRSSTLTVTRSLTDVISAAFNSHEEVYGIMESADVSDLSDSTSDSIGNTQNNESSASSSTDENCDGRPWYEELSSELYYKPEESALSEIDSASQFFRDADARSPSWFDEVSKESISSPNTEPLDISTPESKTPVEVQHCDPIVQKSTEAISNTLPATSKCIPTPALPLRSLPLSKRHSLSASRRKRSSSPFTPSAKIPKAIPAVVALAPKLAASKIFELTSSSRKRPMICLPSASFNAALALYITRQMRKENKNSSGGLLKRDENKAFKEQKAKDLNPDPVDKKATLRERRKGFIASPSLKLLHFDERKPLGALTNVLNVPSPSGSLSSPVLMVNGTLIDDMTDNQDGGLSYFSPSLPRDPSLLNLSWTPKPVLHPITIQVVVKGKSGRRHPNFRGAPAADETLNVQCYMENTFLDLHEAVESVLGYGVNFFGTKLGNERQICMPILSEKYFRQWVNEHALMGGGSGTLLAWRRSPL